MCTILQNVYRVLLYSTSNLEMKSEQVQVFELLMKILLVWLEDLCFSYTCEISYTIHRFIVVFIQYLLTYILSRICILLVNYKLNITFVLLASGYLFAFDYVYIKYTIAGFHGSLWTFWSE